MGLFDRTTFVFGVVEGWDGRLSRVTWQHNNRMLILPVTLIEYHLQAVQRIIYVVRLILLKVNVF